MMKRLNPGAIVLVGCALAAAWSARARAEEPVALKLKWPVGKCCLRRHEGTVTAKFEAPDLPAETHLKLTLDVAVSILKEIPGGGHELEVAFPSVRVRTTSGTESWAFDSADEGEEDAGNPLAALGGLGKATLHCVLDAENRVAKMEGVKELLDHVLAHGSPQAHALARGLFAGDQCKLMVRDCWTQGIPAKGVKVGDTWSFDEDISLEGYGAVHLATRYTFAGWERHLGRRCGLLEASRTFTTKTGEGHADPPPGGVIKDGRTSRKVWLDPESGMAVDAEVDEEASIEFKREGKPVLTCRTKEHATHRLVNVGLIPPAPHAPTPDEINSWIRDLGADTYEQREAATKKLRKAGEAAVPALERAKSDDPEVRARVQVLLGGDNPPPLRDPGALLKQLATHEAVWRQGDYDKNGLLDYWTRDVAGFHAVRDAAGVPLAIISRDIARLDAAPGAAYPELGKPPRVRTGYLLKALRTDQEGNPYVEPVVPAPTARNAPEGRCTNRSRFGFCAYPARYGVDGVLTFLVGEDGVVWQKDLGPDAKGVDSRQEANPETVGTGWSQFGG